MFRRTATGPNEQWQADHTLLDVMLLYKAGDQVRPWLTVVLDDYSRAVAGYTVFLGAPTAEQTGSGRLPRRHQEPPSPTVKKPPDEVNSHSWRVAKPLGAWVSSGGLSF